MKKITFTIILMFILTSMFYCSKNVTAPDISSINENQQTMDSWIVVQGYSKYNTGDPCMANFWLYYWENNQWVFKQSTDTFENGYYSISMTGIPPTGGDLWLHAEPKKSTDGNPQDRYWVFQWEHVENFWWPNDESR